MIKRIGLFLLLLPSLALGQMTLFTHGLRSVPLPAAAPSGPAIDPIVIGWSNRVVAAGGAAPSMSTMTNLAAFVTNISSITNLMFTVNCVATDSVVAACTPLIAYYGANTWTNGKGNNFTTAGFTAAELSVTGLVQNAASSWLDTGLNVSAITGYSNNFGVSIYASRHVSASAYTFGSQAATGVPEITILQGYSGSPTDYFDDPNATAGNGRYTHLSLNSGVEFLSVNRTNKTALSMYQGNGATWVAFSGAATSDGANGVSAMRPFAFYCVTETTSPFYVVNMPAGFGMSFMSIHQGMTSNNAAILFNAVKIVRTGFGGGL